MKFQPIAICWPITASCNYNCRFCYADKYTKDLDFDKQIKIIDILADNGIKFINFTGGEPLLIKNFDELIIHAKKRGIFTDICSNGSLLTPVFVNSVKDHLDQISFPIDGSNDEIQFAVRGQKNHPYFFHRAIKLIQETKIRLKVNTLVCKTNKDDLSNIFKILMEIPRLRRWKLIRYYPVYRYEKNYALTLTQFHQITNKICQLKSPFEIVSKYQPKGYQSSFIILSPAGDIFVTYKRDRLKIGNIFIDNLKKVLINSPEFNKAGHMKKYQEYLDY